MECWIFSAPPSEMPWVKSRFQATHLDLKSVLSSVLWRPKRYRHLRDQVFESAPCGARMRSRPALVSFATQTPSYGRGVGWPRSRLRLQRHSSGSIWGAARCDDHERPPALLAWADAIRPSTLGKEIWSGSVFRPRAWYLRLRVSRFVVRLCRGERRDDRRIYGLPDHFIDRHGLTHELGVSGNHVPIFIEPEGDNPVKGVRWPVSTREKLLTIDA